MPRGQSLLLSKREADEIRDEARLGKTRQGPRDDGVGQSPPTHNDILIKPRHAGRAEEKFNLEIINDRGPNTFPADCWRADTSAA